MESMMVKGSTTRDWFKTEGLSNWIIESKSILKIPACYCEITFLKLLVASFSLLLKFKHRFQKEENEDYIPSLIPYLRNIQKSYF